MTKYEKFMKKNIDELADWIDKHVFFDDAPWIKWWDDKYCKECPIEVFDDDGITSEYGWCEIHSKCKYFQDRDNIPSGKEIIKLWLMSQEIEKEFEYEDD